MRSLHGKATTHRTTTGTSTGQGGFAFEANPGNPATVIEASTDAAHDQELAGRDTGLEPEAQTLVRCQFCKLVNTSKYPKHEEVGLSACNRDLERQLFGYFRGLQAPHVCPHYQEADL